MTQIQESSLNQNIDTASTVMPSENNPNSSKDKKHWLRYLAFLLLLLFFLLSAFVSWIVGTESGLRFGLYKIPSWFGINISSDTLQGTLIKGFEGKDWFIQTSDADINISNFRFYWKPSELIQPSLHITELIAGDIKIITKQTPPKEKKPSEGLPKSINLPAQFYIDKLETGKISVGQSIEKQTVYLEHIKAAYHYNHLEHRLDLNSIATPWGHSVGAATLGLTSPFTLNTAIYTQGALDGETIHSTTRFWGNLQDTQTEIRLDGNNVHLYAQSVLHPFAKTLNDFISKVQIKGVNINPSAFIANLPKAKLNLDASIIPSFSNGIALDGLINLSNHASGTVESGAIPIKNIIGNFTINNKGLVNIKNTAISLLQKGVVNINGNIDTTANQLNLALNINDLIAEDAIEQKFKGKINGQINVKGSSHSPNIDWNLDSGFAKSNGLLSILSDSKLGQQTLKLNKANILPNNGGELNASGSLELFKDKLLKLDIISKNFNPSKIDPQLPSGNVNGNIALNGILAEQKYNGKMQFTPSMLNGVSLSGNADIAYEKSHLNRAITDIKLGSNIIKTNGSFGKKGDKLNLDINAPDLSRFGFGLSGLLNAKGYISGDLSDGLKTFEADINGQARHFHLAKWVQINTLDFKIKGSPNPQKMLNAEIKGDQIILAGESTTRIDTVNLLINGTSLKHRIHGSSNMSIADKRYKLDIDANGGLNQTQTQWKGVVNTLDINGAFNLKLQNHINLEAGSSRVAISPSRWAAMGGNLNLQTFVWDKTTGITTKGNAQNLHMAELHNFYKPPVNHNLILGGDWDLSYSQNARGYLNIMRQGGDIVLPEKNQPLGLNVLSLRTRFQNGRIDALIDGNTRFGKLDGNINISQQFGSNITQAPINGKVNIHLPNLETLRTFLPNNAQSLSGSFNGIATIGGRVSSPTISSQLNGNTNFGKIDGIVNIGQNSDFVSAPLNGRINMNVQNLEIFRNLLPIGQTIKGNLAAAVTLSGRLNEPLLNGTLNGNDLYYRNQTQGLILDNGVLRSHLQGQKWVIDSLKFHRGGTAELKGSISLNSTTPDVDFDITFDKYNTLSRPNRRLQLSGNAKVLYNPTKGLGLNGALKADFGIFGFQKSSMPTLDDDVIVLGEVKKEHTETTPIYMDLDLDLNDNVRFIGDGLNVTLGGTLKLQSRPGESIQGIGTVKIVNGRYKAYGQDLEISKGSISFVGPLTNPNLNIRAERRQSPVGAGVEVLGNLNAPRITLVANESMSEKDKLSWLILNRASSGSNGDEAALSAAAGALLAGKINDRIGLVDDFGFTSKRSRNAQTGELNAAEQVLTVGKQLTNELYLGYEYGIASAGQTVKLMYQLTRSIQAIARVGSESSGGELKYTIRFDHLFRSDKQKETKNKKQNIIVQ